MGAGLVGLRHPPRHHRLAAADEVNARLAEGLLHVPANALDEPVLAVEVVHREHAAGRQVVSCRLHRLLGEQVALQPDLGGPVDQASESGRAKRMRSYLSVLDERNARPSLT